EEVGADAVDAGAAHRRALDAEEVATVVATRDRVRDARVADVLAARRVEDGEVRVPLQPGTDRAAERARELAGDEPDVDRRVDAALPRVRRDEVEDADGGRDPVAGSGDEV